MVDIGFLACPQVALGRMTNVIVCLLQVFGLATKNLIRVLLPKTHSSNAVISELADLVDSKSLALPLLGDGKDGESEVGGDKIPRPTSLRMLLSTPTRTVHYYWRKFDDAIMRPVFGGRGFTPYIPGSPDLR